MQWSVEFLDEAAQAEVLALPKDTRAKFEHVVHLIEHFGLERALRRAKELK